MRKIPPVIIHSFKIKFYTWFAGGVALVMDVSFIHDTAIRFSVNTAMVIERSAKMINDFSPFFSYSLVFLLF